MFDCFINIYADTTLADWLYKVLFITLMCLLTKNSVITHVSTCKIQILHVHASVCAVVAGLYCIKRLSSREIHFHTNEVAVFQVFYCFYTY